MGGDWPTVTIEEIAERVGMGPFGSSIKVETFVPDGVPIISGQHLRGTRVDDGPGFRFITDEHAEKLASANVQRGDIVITHRGNIGQVAYIPDGSEFTRYVVSQSQFYMRCDRSKALPEFVTMYFTSPEGRHKLLANSAQVGVPSIARPVTYLRTIEISLPPLSEQRAIAHVLGTLDDKIELNRRMNETLEAMVRGLFKSWLVDFDPVRAKIEGRDTGLPSHLDDLFPCQMMDSEFGPIPAGWRVATLDAIATLNPESWKRGSAPSVVSYVDLKNTKWGSVEKVLSYDWDKAPSRARRVLRRDDTIVGTVRPGNGSYALITEDGLTGSTGFAVLRPRCRQSRELLWCSATSRINIERLAHLADGGAYPAVRPEAVGETPIVLADAAVRRAFGDVTSALIDRIGRNSRESLTLSSLRDFLLPKLVSGELRVEGVGSTIEAAR